MHSTLPVTHRLIEADRPAIAAHFLALDPEDRRLRFGASVGDVVIREYVERLDFERDGLFAVRDSEGEVVALAHVAVVKNAAELGLSVLSPHRGCGNGGALFARAVDFLRNRNVVEIYVHCLGENAAMRHLASRHRMRISTHGSQSEGRLALRPATVESYIREWLHDQQSAALETIRRNARLARLVWSPRPAVKS